MNVFTRRVTAVVTGTLLAAVLLSGCGGDATEPSEVDRIDDAVNSAMRLQQELEGVTNRLIVECMVTAGFDTHPQDLTRDPAAWIEEVQLLLGSDPPGTNEFPTVAEAEQQGFDPVYPDRYDDTGNEPDPYWDMSSEYTNEYDVARYGPEFYEFMRSGDLL
ncbi:hypothetical protein FB566_3578 [Stackebrandtia endophytica]|uniref:Uncharacterized protein n=1 Tax=Stackebrandtia endophytica TaxID=1496996 RepID=A0A543AZJ1_9ACTN|nr:hypothetical protein [Stackebrandtia endophytica]TQL78003.1 hypothetical protein FB566_3578 [Stackebrandtia endophytica]